MSKAFHYTSIFVALADCDGEHLTQFYTQFLECKPTLYVPQSYSEFHLPGLRLGIFNPKADHQVEFVAPTSGSMSLCIEVEDLQTAIVHLTAIGFPPSRDIVTTSHGKELYVYDPAGNRLILHQSNG